MSGEPTTHPIARGRRALEQGAWQEAADAFEEVLAVDDDPEAHDGLGIALWWLRDVDRAIAEREAAFASLRRRGDDRRAVSLALWLAREYQDALGNEPVSRGWLARAEGISQQLPDGPERGWLALTRGRLRSDPAAALDDAHAAVTAGRDDREPNLEATALALRGLAEIARGDVGIGMTSLDEAMVVATSGEVTDPAVFGDVCCLVTRAAEEAGDVSRLERWNEVVMAFMERTRHPPLLEFCGTCCAEVFLANGQVHEAEGWLVRTLQELEARAQRARCAHPAAKLAELRLLQGRVEEAGRLVEGTEDQPVAVRARAAVHLAQGDTAIASALLLRRLAEVSDGLLAVPLLSLLVEVQLAQGDAVAAGATAARLRGIADRTGWERTDVVALLAEGRVAAAEGDAVRARDRLGTATSIADRSQMPIEASRARLALAEALEESDPGFAGHEGRVAFETLDAAGALALADRASSLLRRLGGPARTGPKALGLLTKREREVLALLGEGLTNSEIATRLYIAPKTAEHHVSNVLGKLHLENRAQAAAFALRSADPIRGEK